MCLHLGLCPLAESVMSCVCHIYTSFFCCASWSLLQIFPSFFPAAEMSIFRAPLTAAFHHYWHCATCNHVCACVSFENYEEETDSKLFHSSLSLYDRNTDQTITLYFFVHISVLRPRFPASFCSSLIHYDFC